MPPLVSHTAELGKVRAGTSAFQHLTANNVSRPSGKHMSLKLLVIDDHPLVMKGVIAALDNCEIRVLPAYDGRQALQVLDDNPDVSLVLLDLALPGPGRLCGHSMITRIHERVRSLPVLVLSALEEPETVRLAISGGAVGFVPKSAGADRLLNAIEQVMAGHISVPMPLSLDDSSDAVQPTPDIHKLTRRQSEVLKAVCQGKSNREVAAALGVTEKTIKAHITGVFRALRVVTRTQAVLIARRLGLMPH